MIGVFDFELCVVEVFKSAYTQSILIIKILLNFLNIFN